MKKGLIICAFPGIGKTYLSNARIGYIDLPSRPFNDIKNYIMVAEYLASEGKNVLLDCSISIRQLLNKSGISFVTVLPFLEDKDTYKERLFNNNDNHHTFLEKEYESLCAKTKYDKCVYRIQKTQYLNDIIGNIRLKEQNKQYI